MKSNSLFGYNENQLKTLIIIKSDVLNHNGTLRALVWAKVSMMDSKLMVLAILCSMANIDKDTSLSCFVLFLNLFFTWAILLKDLSPDATVTGKVEKILRAIDTFGKMVASFNFTNLFKRVKGLIFLSLILASWISFKRRISEHSFSPSMSSL